MSKRKKSAWLQIEGYEHRGRATKPMSPEKVAVRWRQIVAKNANKGVAPIRDSMGTLSYPTPKDPPDLNRVGYI